MIFYEFLLTSNEGFTIFRLIHYLLPVYNEEKWKPLQSYHDHNGFFGCKKDVLRIDTKSFINTNIIVKS